MDMKKSNFFKRAKKVSHDRALLMFMQTDIKVDLEKVHGYQTHYIICISTKVGTLIRENIFRSM
jgi:hypothetical protein